MKAEVFLKETVAAGSDEPAAFPIEESYFFAGLTGLVMARNASIGGASVSLLQSPSR